MENYSITLPAWTVGEKALDKVVEICAPHGKTAALIGGRRALGAIAAQIKGAVQGKIDITAERLAAADRIILGKTGGKTVEFPHGYLLYAGKGVIRLYQATI